MVRWYALALPVLVSERSGVVPPPPGEGERDFAGVWKSGTPKPSCWTYMWYSSLTGLAGPKLSDAVEAELRPTMPTSRDDLWWRPLPALEVLLPECE